MGILSRYGIWETGDIVNIYDKTPRSGRLGIIITELDNRERYEVKDEYGDTSVCSRKELYISYDNKPEECIKRILLDDTFKRERKSEDYGENLIEKYSKGVYR